ncbi:hypothetical protein KM043_007144 [Ampulex compressa]|nr:hypothetical protein KM043_007144 [Ampulex compressa]
MVIVCIVIPPKISVFYREYLQLPTEVQHQAEEERVYDGLSHTHDNRLANLKKKNCQIYGIVHIIDKNRHLKT